MKKITIILLAFSFIVTACVKEKPFNPNNLFIAATTNDGNWVATPSANVIGKTDSIQIQGIKETTGGEQKLSITLQFNGLGTYDITGQQATYINYLEGGSETCQLDNTQTNQVKIETYNAATSIITGTFQLHLINTTTGDKANFTGGSFWLLISQ